MYPLANIAVMSEIRVVPGGGPVTEKKRKRKKGIHISTMFRFIVVL